MRACLNGEGAGRGRYISLFFVTMKGDYDPLLRWPFLRNVTMSILHQDGGEDIWVTCLPDWHGISNQLPQQEVTVAGGCQKLAKHDDIEKEGSKYLVDDTMFLKIVVGINNISPAECLGINMRN